MTNPNEPINAILEQSPFLQNDITFGLTKREYFAGLAMSSMSVDGVMLQNGVRDKSPEGISKMAIDYADELIKQLNKQS